MKKCTATYVYYVYQGDTTLLHLRVNMRSKEKRKYVTVVKTPSHLVRR